jgi:diguanylate cyclase (GGDEF)-like protein
MAAAKGSERSTDKLLKLLDEPLPKGETILARLDATQAATGQPAHANLLRLLTHLGCTNDAARQVWSAFELHRATLERRLGRDVGPRVALFDYLLNVDRRLSNPKIIELSEFERTEKSAVTDHLTGLFNRGHFDDCLRKEINRCRRYGQTASLLMLDLDDFKSINDQYGHVAGDSVLRDVGRLLVQRVRDIDVAARYGGEEFSIILPETRRMSAYVVAERIRSEVERFFKRKIINGREVRATLSGGIAAFPEDAEDPEALVIRADEALYRAKHAGKNLVSIFYLEKRKASRINIESHGIRVQLEGGRTEASAAGRALNISEGGILIETSRKLELGENVEVKLPLGPGQELSLVGEVVRLEPRQNGRKRVLYDAGLKFRFGRRASPPQLSRFLRESAAVGA